MTKHTPEYTRAVLGALGRQRPCGTWMHHDGAGGFDSSVNLPIVEEADRRALSRLVARTQCQGEPDEDRLDGYCGYYDASGEWVEGFGFHPAGTTPQAWGQAMAAADAVGMDKALRALDELLGYPISPSAKWLRFVNPDERGGFLCAAIVRATDDRQD